MQQLLPAVYSSLEVCLWKAKFFSFQFNSVFLDGSCLPWRHNACTWAYRRGCRTPVAAFCPPWQRFGCGSGTQPASQDKWLKASQEQENGFWQIKMSPSFSWCSNFFALKWRVERWRRVKILSIWALRELEEEGFSAHFLPPSSVPSGKRYFFPVLGKHVEPHFMIRKLLCSAFSFSYSVTICIDLLVLLFSSPRGRLRNDVKSQRGGKQREILPMPNALFLFIYCETWFLRVTALVLFVLLCVFGSILRLKVWQEDAFYTVRRKPKEREKILSFVSTRR